MIYMNYPARIPEGRQNEQSADLLTVSVFRDLPEEFDEAATVRGAENLLRRNRHRAYKRRLSQAYSLPRQIIPPAVAAPLADQSGQRGTLPTVSCRGANGFMRWNREPIAPHSATKIGWVLPSH